MVSAVLAGWLALCEALEPPNPGPTSAPPTTAATPSITTLAVSLTPADRAALTTALSLRTPALRVVDFDVARPQAAPGTAYLELTPTPEDPARIHFRLILWDGRAFARELPVDPDERLRPVASAIANLLAAIAEDSVQPDARDVPFPTSGPPPSPAPTVSGPEPPPVAVPRTPRSSRTELSPLVHGGLSIGLGAPSALAGLVAGGGGLGLDARLPGGFAISIDTRYSSWERDSYRIHRFRVALGAGYIPRFGAFAFELPITALVTVDPWWVRGPTASGLTDVAGEPADAALLLGAALRISPGYRLLLPGDGALRIGLRLEIAGSVSASGRALRISREEPETGELVPLFRAGGLELFVGPELAFWLPSSLSPRDSSRPGSGNQSSWWYPRRPRTPGDHRTAR